MSTRKRLIKAKQWLYGKLYRQETGYLLNYLTLGISNEYLLQQLKEHRATRFGQLIGIYFFLSSLALIYNVVLFLVANGHPLLIVTSVVTLSGFMPIFYWHCKGKLWLATYLCLPYMLVHSVAAVCCYRGWLAPGLTIPNKDIFDF